MIPYFYGDIDVRPKFILFFYLPTPLMNNDFLNGSVKTKLHAARCAFYFSLRDFE